MNENKLRLQNENLVSAAVCKFFLKKHLVVIPDGLTSMVSAIPGETSVSTLRSASKRNTLLWYVCHGRKKNTNYGNFVFNISFGQT